MSRILYPPARPQAIGEVLDGAFRIFSATVLRCLPYGVLAMVAGQLQNIYDLATGRPLHRFGGGDPVWWVLYALGAFLVVVLINAILLRQRAVAAGLPAPSGVLWAGLRRAPGACAVILLALAAVAVFFLPLISIPRAHRAGALAGLAVPACYVGVMLSCSWTAFLIGDKGVIASMRYSVHLVRGDWWRSVTVYAVAIAMLGVFYALAGIFAAVLVPFAGIADIAVVTAVSTVMAAALGAVAVPFYSSIVLALYGDLEARKEGTDLERRTAGAAAG